MFVREVCSRIALLSPKSRFLMTECFVHNSERQLSHGLKRSYDESETSDAQKFDSEYYFENGLRKVYPYYFEYYAHCKRRWIGEKLIDVIDKEFRSIPKRLLIPRFESGLVTVNAEKVDPNYVLKDGDKVTSRVHRHENAVLASSINKIYESEDLLVIDKPPSLPVHSCGRYRLNSLIFILKREHGYEKIHVCHRLDRLTSGVLILAKNIKKANELMNQIQNRVVGKEYVCKVEGEFPNEEITCEQPIARLSHKIGLFFVQKGGKESITKFKKLSSNGKTSIVLCKPLTGRTHQIRIHLQFLGYPIVNDVLYNSYAFGPSKGKNADFGKSKEQLIADIMAEHPIEHWVDYNHVSQSLKATTPKKQKDETDFSNFGIYSPTSEMKQMMDKHKFDAAKVTLDEMCEDCGVNCREPSPEDLFQYLHCLRYKGPDWEFETPLPFWAEKETM